MTDGNPFEEYDRQMSEELGELPLSNDIVAQTTPWKSAVFRILTGLALTTFTLNFYYLQYILPSLGVALIYLGFRTLRRDSRWFRACFVLSGIRLLFVCYTFFILTTRYSQISWLSAVNTTVGVLLIFSVLFTFRMALRRAFVEADEEPDGDPLLFAMIWYAVVLVLALTPLKDFWPSTILMIFFYILILRSLYAAGQDLDQWGYQVKAAPVRIGGKLFIILYTVLILLCIAAGSIFFSRVPMKACETALPAAGGQQSVRDHLTELGFPEDVLSDIPDEELKGLGNAIRCSSRSSDMNFDGDHMAATTVYTELPGGILRTVIYFQWTKAPAVFWQDAIQIEGDDLSIQHASGRILYDKDGSSYAAPLDLSTSTGQSVLFSGRSYNQILSKFSYPFRSSKQRGYVQYTVNFTDSSRLYLYSLLNYYHQTNPVVLSYEDVLKGFSSGKYSFTGQMKQHDASYATALNVKLYGDSM